MTNTFWPDHSVWQGIRGVNAFDAVHAHRIDSGYGTDSTWGQTFANARVAHEQGRLHMLIAYWVFRPGHENAQFQRMVAATGGRPPSWLSWMCDMESGADFAGPGDHSAAANAMVARVGTYSGRGTKAVAGYAGQGDWAGCWPRPAAGLKRIVAKYSSQPPTIPWWGWQYSDGAGWPYPAGWPYRAGQDMNMTPRSVASVLDAFGVTLSKPLDNPTLPKEDDMWIVYSNKPAQTHLLVLGPAVIAADPRTEKGALAAGARKVAIDEERHQILRSRVGAAGSVLV